TVQEKFNLDNPVECMSGPVFAEGCTDVCVECEGSLHRGTVPLHSLVNHLWLGAVPWQLQDLMFAEQMLISKVRHNCCVVRVASGRGKLVGNAIMFSTPVAKVYNREDAFSEVLAFVFLGSAKPTGADFARTPMLVRRRRVQDALDWLKLNHEDYDCLTISKENLEALPENGIPCGVDWKQTDSDSSNLVPESMSVDNN
ncbi:hypothetical protein K438DRAFT_1489440, partial [Mycena galopus ATCC 62051]